MLRMEMPDKNPRKKWSEKATLRVFHFSRQSLVESMTKARLRLDCRFLRRYWAIPGRQIETSLVLAATWRELSEER